jgi:two-component system, NtrC family, response regulator HydG
MPHALIVDDDLSFLMGLAEVVGREGFSTATARSVEEARVAVERQPPDILLTDLQLPDGSGLDLLPSEAPGVRSPDIVLITGHASVETAIEALRRGVADYLTKPVDFGRVKMVLANVARTRELKAEIGSLRHELRKLGRFGAMVGACPEIQRVYDLICRVAPTEATILVVGETGTGKELVAQTVHELSSRRNGPFLPVNCGAVPSTLIESELFGHERGSFTGADRVHRGFFERAHRGTLFLDEVTEMPVELQVKLLRVLETGMVTRLGGSEAIKLDVRVIAATNRKPEDAVDQGKLREDLLYRLNVFPIAMPPLRDRRPDIELLAEDMLTQLNQREGTQKRLTRACLERLSRYTWPGNIRELKNVIQRAFILSEDEIRGEDLPLAGSVPRETSRSGLGVGVGMTIEEAERCLIEATLASCGGDKRHAADMLGISLKTLYNRLGEYRATGGS